MVAAFPVYDDDVSIAHLHIGDDPVVLSQEFSKRQPSQSPFDCVGIMVDGMVWTMKVMPKYKGVRTMLGDVLVHENDVPAEFFIDAKNIEQWKYLKGAKKEQRKSDEGFAYNYSEGAMMFPDDLNKPSRTIITGEGGSAPSRFKHIVKTETGRLRRLTPVELERLNMFPDNHTEGPTSITRAFLMGNALVTGVIQKLGHALAVSIAEKQEGDIDTFEASAFIPDIYIKPYRIKKGEPEQLLLCESQIEIYKTKHSAILHGTYRKTCRKWIEDNRLYSLPMTKAKCREFPMLRKIKHLVLTHKSDAPLYFDVKSCRWITKDELKKLGHPTNSRHPKSLTYLLYSLCEGKAGFALSGRTDSIDCRRRTANVKSKI